MRQRHRAGEKMFVDYSGAKPWIVDPSTGEVTDVEFFVAVLGASSYTFTEAARTQQLYEWIASHNRALRFFGGSAEIWVPDQLKSGVTSPCRYEPGVQRTYHEQAVHYDAVVMPACRSRSAGSWRGFATRPSSRSRPSTSASASSTRSSTTGR
jgi:transposase